MLGNASGVPGELDFLFNGKFAYQVKHAHPFGKDDDFAIRVLQQFGYYAFELIQLGTFIGSVRVKNLRCVAHHSHACEASLQSFHLFRSQRALFRDVYNSTHDFFVVIVKIPLFLSHWNKVCLGCSSGQVLLDVLLAAPEHDRRDPLNEFVKVFVSDCNAFLIQLVEFPIESEQRSHQAGVQKLNDGVDFVNSVLQGCARKNECVTASQFFHGSCGLGAPVLDSLSLVEDDDFRIENFLDFRSIRQYLLVVA